jgi:hypothetical protein
MIIAIVVAKRKWNGSLKNILEFNQIILIRFFNAESIQYEEHWLVLEESESFWVLEGVHGK